MQKNKHNDKLLLIGVAAILLIGGVGLSAFPATRFSGMENRHLAAFPTFSAEALANGTYTAGLDDYASERVPFRGICRRVYAMSELAMGRKESHGVILCRDGSLCRRIDTNEAVYERNLAALSRLCKRVDTLPLTVAIAPRRIDVRSETLPALYDTARERAVWERLPAGIVTFLDSTDDAQWYHTDHHWTQEGAYFAYVRLSHYLGYKPYPTSDFKVQAISENFLGTSAAAAGFSHITPDTVSVWHYRGEEIYRVLRDGKPASFRGLYDEEKLLGSDKYAVFLGGNSGILQIDLGESDSRPTLLVIKDSFANSLLPFLARHYRICAVDPRYHADSLHSLIKDADALLVLCGMQTLTQSPFLSLLR